MNTHLLLASALLLTAPACHSNRGETHAPAQTTTTVQPDDTPLKMQQVVVKQADRHSFEAQICVPVSGPQPLADSLTVFVKKWCGIETPDCSPIRPQLLEMAAKFISEGKDCDNEMKANSGEDDDLMPAWEATRTVELNTSNERYVTLHANAYIYTGGAHGMPADEYYTFDAHTGRCITYHDVFASAHSREMLKLVEQELHRQCNLDDDFWDFHLPATVALVPQGICFGYAAYEIGPYAIGMPSCILKPAQVSAYLTPYGKKLLGM